MQDHGSGEMLSSWLSIGASRRSLLQGLAIAGSATAAGELLPGKSVLASPSGTPLSSRTSLLCVETIAELRALEVQKIEKGTAVPCVTVLGYHAPGDGVGHFRWDASSTEAENGGTIIIPNSSPPAGRWKRLVEGPLSVRWFGARGDGVTNDREAIQDAINSARSVSSHPDGAVIFFPEGRYVVRGGSLVLPRLSGFGLPRVVIFKGTGWLVSTIINDNPTWEPTDPTTNIPLFVADPDPGNNFGAKGYVFEDLHLGAGKNNQEVFVWDVPPPSGATWSPDEGRYRIEAFFHRVVFSSGKNLAEVAPNQPSVGPRDRHLVRLHGGSRTRFLHCLFYGLGFDSTSQKSKDFHGGAAVKLRDCGGITLTDCHTLDAGAMLDVEGGGELVVLNSRSEGGYGRPAWRFVNTRNITLINLANEGRYENPSIFYFERCRQVVVTNPQVAAANLPIEGDKYPDGIQFIACENCRIVGSHGNDGKSFKDQGDGQARMIRVDADSKYIVGEGIQTSADSPQSDFDIQGHQCCFEIWGSNPSVKRMVKIGDCPT